MLFRSLKAIDFIFVLRYFRALELDAPTTLRLTGYGLTRPRVFDYSQVSCYAADGYPASVTAIREYSSDNETAWSSQAYVSTNGSLERTVVVECKATNFFDGVLHSKNDFFFVTVVRWSEKLSVFVQSIHLSIW